MDDPLTLAETAAWITGHAAIETELFRVTGFWSTSPVAGSGTLGASTQSLLAVQSAHHGWRAEQWEERIVASVQASGEALAPQRSAEREIAAIGEILADDPGPAERLAIWGYAWAPSLAARYWSHRRRLAPAADAGVLRWLDMCITDLQRGMPEAVDLLRSNAGEAERIEAVRAAGEALERLLGT